MAHQLWPGRAGSRRRRRIVREVARDLVTGEWQRAHGRAGGLSMSPNTVVRYRDLLVRGGVLVRLEPRAGRRASRFSRSGLTRYGERFTIGPRFGDVFRRGRLSRVGLLLALLRRAVVHAFGSESVPMPSFVLRTQSGSSNRQPAAVEKGPAAPADVGSGPAPPPNPAGFAGSGDQVGEADQQGEGPRAGRRPSWLYLVPAEGKVYR